MRKHKRDEASGEGYDKPIPDILSQIKDSYTELRPAERRVADVVLADVTFSVDASNAEIAKRAEVSEPTVTRFCRAIGCDGVRDFKLKLAQSVVVGRLYLSRQPAVRRADRERLAAVERRVRRGAQRAQRRRAADRPARHDRGGRTGRERASGAGVRARRQFRPRWRRKRRTGCSATASWSPRTPTPM